MSWSYSSWLSTHRPDCSVPWASQLRPPNVGEVRNALLAEKPACRSWVVPASRTAETLDEIDEYDEDVFALQGGEQAVARHGVCLRRRGRGRRGCLGKFEHRGDDRRRGH